MRKLLAFFVLTTATFAASTVYFALELRARDASGIPLAAPPTNHAMDARTPGPTAATRAGAPPSTPSAIDSRKSEFDRAQAEVQADYRAQLLRDLSDPAKRAALVEQRKKLKRAQEPRLAAYLGLNDNELDALFTLLAEDGLAEQEVGMHCTALPCLTPEAANALAERKRIAIEELLGVDRAKRYAQYEQTRSERMNVDKFRTDLPDRLRMSDDQYEQLIVALADERQKFQRNAESRGLMTFGFGDILYDENQHSLEERLAAGREYSERLEARASAVLNTEQAREYARMREAGLVNMENALPYLDSLNAHGLPGGTSKH